MKGQSEHNNLKKKFEEFTYPVGASNWDVISSRLPSGSGNGTLANKFSNYTAQPSSHVWSNIASVIKPTHAKRPVAWWWVASAASLLAFMYIGYALFNSSNHQVQLAQGEISNGQQIKNDGPSGNSLSPEGQDSSYSAGVSSKGSVEPGAAFGERSAKTVTSTGTQADVGSLMVVETTTPGKSGKNTAESIEKPTSRGEHGSHNHGAKSPVHSAAYAQRAVGPVASAALKNPGVQVHVPPPVLAVRRPEVALAKVTPQEKPVRSTGFYDGTENSAPQELSLWAGSLMAFSGTGDQHTTESASFAGTGTNSLSSGGDFVTTDFSPPIYYGINGEVKFWNRMALGLGVGFLHMRTASTHHFDTGQPVIQQINKSYLSVPVYLKFNFIDKSGFAAYTAAGHGYDILIGQKISTETNLNTPPVAGNIPLDMQRGNQANVYASLGMHFKFTRQFGIFAEGSLMHYYHMSNSNFFSQQTYWPALRFGLLVSFE